MGVDMTTGGDFSYTEDSVVAKVSVDIDATSVTSVNQLTHAMSALRTEQEANARAMNSWVSYLNEIPAISERTNQAYRESITLMERMAYISSEISGGPTSNVGPTAVAGPGDQPSYSTAAAPGYVSPWDPKAAGTGSGTGNPYYGFIQAMAGQDPRMFANMMAARGIPVNPAQMGMVGGAAAGDWGAGGIGGTGGGEGHGASAPGSLSPQKTQHARAAAAPPDPTQSGSPTTSELQHTPGEPHADAPGWQRSINEVGLQAKQVMDEGRLGGPPEAAAHHVTDFLDRGGEPTGEGHKRSRSADDRFAQTPTTPPGGEGPADSTQPSSLDSNVGGDPAALAEMVANELRVSGGRVGGIGGTQGVSDAMKALGSKAAGSIASKLGMSTESLGGAAAGLGSVGAVATGALALNEVIQRLGEKVTEYSQLGSVQGGGAAEGFGYEMQARITGLNPFITTEQARTVMQMALREGFRGGNFDTVQQFMIKNFKDMGLSFSDSMDFVKTTINAAGESTHTFGQNMADLQKTMDTMKILTKEGGASLPTREEQLKNSMETLTALAVPPEIAHQIGPKFQESFKSKLLQDKMPDQMNNALQNPLFLEQMALNKGMGGVLPEEVLPKMAESGIDIYGAAMDQLTYLANQSRQMSNGDFDRGASIFRELMKDEGVTLDPVTARDLYRELISGRDIKGEANKALADAANQRLHQKKPVTQTVVESMLTQATGTVQDPLQRGKDILGHAMKDEYSDVAKELPGFGLSLLPGTGYIKNLWNGLFGDSTHNQAAQDQADQNKKNTASGGDNAPQKPVQTEGTVTGNLTVTVLQNGQVQAPPTIQLTGQQKTANAGWGGAQLNNAPPGDPTYNHAYTGWNR